MGVWIETSVGALKRSRATSHPTWVCGLKHDEIAAEIPKDGVTPYVGVWIETKSSFATETVETSHPTWVCGLKHSERQHSDCT